MTNNQLTRERLQEIAEDGFLKHGESKELARMALAAMDSKPVVWVMLEDLADKDIVSTPAYPDINDAMEMTHGELEPLYRHAQQPVVPDGNFYTETQKKVLLEAANVLVTRKPTVTHGYLIREVGRIAIRALGRPQAAPVVPPMQHWEELCREHPDMSIGDAIIRAAWWNHYRRCHAQWR